MARSGGGVFAVILDPDVWSQEVERYTSERVKRVALAARELIDVQGGLAPDQLRRCEPAGQDGTELAGCVKAYLPLDESAPSSRPYAFVLRWRSMRTAGRSCSFLPSASAIPVRERRPFTRAPTSACTECLRRPGTGAGATPAERRER